MSFELNQKKISLVRNNKLFVDSFTNEIASLYIDYLMLGSYGNLRNPEPIDLHKNTLSKNLLMILSIDSFLKKSISEVTIQDIDKYVYAYRNGDIKKINVKVKRVKGNDYVVNFTYTQTPRDMSNLRRIIGEYKRLCKVYKEYLILNNQPQKALALEWINNYKVPKIKKTYEDYPILSLNKIIEIAESLSKKEYTARMLISVNLMGRKCEVSHLKLKDIDKQEDGSIWIKLPDVKKHSSEKVRVELFDYAKKRFMSYLEIAKINDSEALIFPSKETAFAKNLKEKSALYLGKSYLKPKTLRKLGVCVARELNISRDKVEDIGGWRRNSPILEHYFKRSGVAVDKSINAQINKTEYVDIYAEFDKIKAENQQQKESMQMIKQLLIQQLIKKDKLTIEEEKEQLNVLYNSF
jgi:integrase